MFLFIIIIIIIIFIEITFSDQNMVFKKDLIKFLKIQNTHNSQRR